MSIKYMERLTHLGRKVSDSTILMHEAIARKVGLTGTDHKYLGLILQNDKMTAGELSNLSGLTTGAVTGVIDRLEKQNLVKREFDPTDRRKILIIPNTERVEELFSFLEKLLKKRVEDLIQKFNDDELKAIDRYLSESIKIMNQVTQELNKNQ